MTRRDAEAPDMVNRWAFSREAFPKEHFPEVLDVESASGDIEDAGGSS